MNQIECKILRSSFPILKDITFYFFLTVTLLFIYSSSYTEEYRWLVKPTNKYVHDEWMLKFLIVIISCCLTNTNFYMKQIYSSTAERSSVFTMNKIERKIFLLVLSYFQGYYLLFFNDNSYFYNYRNVYIEKYRWLVKPTNKYVHDEWMTLNSWPSSFYVF